MTVAVANPTLTQLCSLVLLPPLQASWVSQASFDPPGVTVAVKKDRAMSDMMTPGNKFAMSMLAESKYKSAMKVRGG